jgi:hypothetical protein
VPPVLDIVGEKIQMSSEGVSQSAAGCSSKRCSFIFAQLAITLQFSTFEFDFNALSSKALSGNGVKSDGRLVLIG